MTTYEEQKELLREIKKYPDVKKLYTAAKIFQILGYIFLIFAVGVVFWIVGDALERKCEKRINQLLVVETAKRENLFIWKQEEEEQIRVERLVRICKTNNIMEAFQTGFLAVACILLLFMPIGKVWDIENVSIFNLIKDYFQNGQDSLLSLLSLRSWQIFFLIILCMGSIMFIIMSIVKLIEALVGDGEKAIRESRGEILGALRLREIRAGSIVQLVLVVFICMPILIAVLLVFPILLCVELQEIMSINVFMAVLVCLLLLMAYIIAIADCIFRLKNQKDEKQVIGIKAVYERRKKIIR